jgi:hypothetical protein
MLISLVFVFALFILYGFFRAVYEAETASGVATAAASGGASTLPPAQGGAALGNAGARAFFSTPAAPTTTLFSPPQQQQTAMHAAAVPRPVIGNRTLGIYHLPDCDWADKIARNSRVEFDSASDAHSYGFRPCRVCKP